MRSLLVFHQDKTRDIIKSPLIPRKQNTYTAGRPGSGHRAWTHPGDLPAAPSRRHPPRPDRTPTTTGTAAPTLPSPRPAPTRASVPPPTSGITRWTSSSTTAPPPPPGCPRATSSAASRRRRGQQQTLLLLPPPERMLPRGRIRVLDRRLFLLSPIPTRCVSLVSDSRKMVIGQWLITGSEGEFERYSS